MALRAGRCPRCSVPLAGFDYQGTVPLLCPVCRGMFLRGEDVRRHLGPSSTALVAGAGPSELAVESRIACPAGCGPAAPRTVEGGGIAVTIDVCDRCGGVWFDAGKLGRVQQAGRDPARREAPTSPAPPGAPPAGTTHETAEAILRRDQALQELDGPGGGPKSSFGWWLFSFVTNLPLEGYNPVYRFPIFTWLLIVACLGVFGLEIAWGEPFILAWALVPERLVSGGHGLRQLVGSVFLHGGVLHLLGNLYFLKIFGDNVEDRLGRALFLPFYLACGLAADLTYVWTVPTSSIPMVGASGAIAGLLGAYLVLFPSAHIAIAPQFLTLYRRVPVRAFLYLPFWFLWQFVASALSPRGVAWWAHIGGFAAGLVLATMVRALFADPRIGAIAEKLAAPPR